MEGRGAIGSFFRVGNWFSPLGDYLVYKFLLFLEAESDIDLFCQPEIQERQIHEECDFTNVKHTND